MNISTIKKEECCGCSACIYSCPHNAISLSSDSEGFKYPIINSHLCTNCGICLNVCNSKSKEKLPCLCAYSVKNKNDDVLYKSSSGGVSHGLCREIIAENGVIYGVVYDESFHVLVQRIDCLEDCEALYGSKYVQADPGNSLEQIYEDLKIGRNVLVFGTSCYIAGLISFLKCKRVKTDSLITVDLICHGVPSPLLFQDYIKWLDKNGNLQSFQFRTKAKPWGYGSKNFGCTITRSDGRTEVDTIKARVFLQLFFSNNCLRPHCHECQFAGVDKPADLTIADYWGCAEQEPDFFSEKGVSAVLVHTKKGEKLLIQSKELEIKKTTVEKISKKQGNLGHASPISSDRSDFWNLYYTRGFKAIAQRYGSYTVKQKIKRIIYNLLRK